MSKKPYSIASVLQEGLPKVAAKPGIKLSNRFNVFSRSDRSVSATSGRGESEKRARVESPDPVYDRNQAFTSMAGEEEKMKRARELVDICKSGVKDLAEREMSGPLMGILNAMTEWMDLTTGNQVTIANVVVDSYNKVASPPRKSRRDSPNKRGKPETDVDPEETEKATKKKKFIQEVREAEKCSLIFKTNMGTVPVLNPDTMKRKFAEDLAAKGALVEEADSGRPSPAVAAQLDDALEMVTKMEFFGKVTKKAKKKGKTGGRGLLQHSHQVGIQGQEHEGGGRVEVQDPVQSWRNSALPPYTTQLYQQSNRRVQGEISRTFYSGNGRAEKFQLKVSKMKGGVWTNNVETLSLPDSVLDLSWMGPISGTEGKPAASRPSVSDNMEVAESGGVQG
jgi:hypothetical protein